MSADLHEVIAVSSAKSHWLRVLSSDAQAASLSELSAMVWSRARVSISTSTTLHMDKKMVKKNEDKDKDENKNRNKNKTLNDKENVKRTRTTRR